MSHRRPWIAPVVLALACACERRVEDPPARSTEPARGGPPASAGPLAPFATAERCIDPTPEEPVRKVEPGPHPRCPADPGRPPLPWGRVSFEEAGVNIGVEIARTESHRQRGLMFRTTLPDTEGMVFVYDKPAILRFWMKNTCLPLDMLFVDGDGVIVGIQENVPTSEDPSDEDPEKHPSFFVRCPSRYVIEVAAGWSRRHGVRAGHRVRLEGM
jgi:uncharacterized membrane protein (UPF0127 family)